MIQSVYCNTLYSPVQTMPTTTVLVKSMCPITVTLNIPLYSPQGHRSCN